MREKGQVKCDARAKVLVDLVQGFYSQHHQQHDDDNNDESYKFWTRIFCGVMSIYDYDNNNINNNINNNDNNNYNDALLKLQNFTTNYNNIDNDIIRNDNDIETYSILSMYILSIIKLYDDKCNNPIVDGLQIHNFIISCLMNIKQSIIINSSEKEDLNEAAKLSLHILQTLFCKGSNLKCLIIIIRFLQDYQNT